MTKLIRILIVDDSEDDAFLMLRVLKTAGFEVHSRRVQTQGELENALDTGTWDLMLSDYRMPRFDTYAAMAVLQQRKLDIPCVVVSGAIPMENAIAFIKAGARDFVEKDEIQRLIPVIQRELQLTSKSVAENSIKIPALELLYTALDHVSDAVGLVETQADSAPRLCYVNPALAVLSGQAPRELTGQTPEVLTQDQAFYQRMLRHLHTGQAFSAVTPQQPNEGGGLLQWQLQPLHTLGESRYWLLNIHTMAETVAA